MLRTLLVAAITAATPTIALAQSYGSPIFTSVTIGGANGQTITGVGTTAGTIAAGNDSRILGAAQTANNLSDLASASTARTNLGLGSLSTQNATSAAITGGAIDGTAIGGTTPAAGSFTTLSALTPIAATSGGTGYISLSAAFDGLFSTVQGSLLYRGLSGWQGLVPGTPGQVLQTSGSGGNPSWVTLPAASAIPPAGQVRLAYSSSTALTLCPRGGNQIYVGGANRTLSACQTLTNTGLVAATAYYAYEYWTGSALAYEFSTIGHTTDTATGMEFKTGDSSRTLVGMVYTAAGTPGTFADSTTQRYVASWFNRRGVALSATMSALQFGGTSPAFTSQAQVQFLTWSDETVQGGLEGSVQNDTTNAISTTQYGVDGSGVGSPQSPNIYSGGQRAPIGIPWNTTLSEGLHSTTAAISVSSGTGTWTLTNSVTTRQ